jgi:hypothetical protein
VTGAIIGEAAVVACALFTNMAWLWWNVVGCATGFAAAITISMLRQGRAEARPA